MMLRPLHKILMFAVVSVGLGVALTAMSGEPPQRAMHPTTTTAPAVAANSPVETNTAYAGWRQKTISALASKFVHDWEFNLSYDDDEEEDGTHVHLMPRGETVFDGEIDLWFSPDEKLVKMKGDYLEQPRKEYVSGRDIRIAHPLVIPIEKMPNPLDMRVWMWHCAKRSQASNKVRNITLISIMDRAGLMVGREFMSAFRPRRKEQRRT